jgi:DNA-binding protein YbaB
MTALGQPAVPAFDRGMIDEALNGLKAEHAKVVEAQRKMNEATEVVNSQDRSVSVTVDGRGEVVKVAFKGTKYRSMPAAELGRLVTDTIAAARRKVYDRMESVLGPMIPEALGLDVGAALRGDADLGEMVDKLVNGFTHNMPNITPPSFGPGGRSGR